MFLTKILSRMLQNASRRHVSPSAATGVARVPANTAPTARQVDGPTVPLPPVNARYVSRRGDVKNINRSDVTAARKGTPRAAVGL